MTRALVTQMQSALEGVLKAHRIQESRTPPTTFSEANAKVDAIKYAVGDAEKAITAACEYLATEPIGERAELIAELRAKHDERFVVSPSPYSRAANMLEADAQPKDKGPWCAGMTKDARVYVQSDDFKRDARLYVNGDFATKNEEYLYACALARHLNATAETMSANSQQAKQVPMTLDEIEKLWIESGRDIPYMEFKDAVQMTEANHGITQADNPADDESEDLYALALKADNWGQP